MLTLSIVFPVSTRGKIKINLCELLVRRYVMKVHGGKSGIDPRILNVRIKKKFKLNLLQVCGYNACFIFENSIF
jgi:hypothetical protein